MRCRPTWRSPSREPRSRGQQLVQIDNIGAQPHFVTSGTTQFDITDADLEAFLKPEMTGTPAAVERDPWADFQESFFSGTQSTRTSVWLPVDLAAGNLIMLCYFPDMADGMPHASHGMYSIVEVDD